MTLIQKINNLLDETILRFNQELSDRYNLDMDDLNSVWKNLSCENKTKTPKVTNDLAETELNKLKKPELQELCKSKNLKSSGTKAELIAVLLSKTFVKEVNKAKPSVSSDKKNDASVIEKKVIMAKPTIAIRKNKFGNHTHPETSLVFDEITKKVIGKQNENGKIDDLTSEDIDVCNQYNFEFVIPKNLDKKVNLDDVQLDELGEEDGDTENSGNETIDEEEILENDDELIEDDEDEGVDDFAEYE
jgi:hypothetical protein